MAEVYYKDLVSFGFVHPQQTKQINSFGQLSNSQDARRYIMANGMYTKMSQTQIVCLTNNHA